MKLRTITTFLDPGWPLNEKLLDQAAHFNRAAQSAFTREGYEVQTTRLATIPFPQLLTEITLTEALTFAQTLENAATARGYSYLCVGPATPDHLSAYALLPDMFLSLIHI